MTTTPDTLAKLAAHFEDCVSAEPTLGEMVRGYYRQHFSEEGADLLADRYFATLTAQAPAQPADFVPRLMAVVKIYQEQAALGMAADEMAHRALAAQALPAAEPVAWQARFTANKAWSECTKEHHDWVKRAPEEFEGYEARELYAAPQAARQAAPTYAQPCDIQRALAAQQAAQATAGWVMVPEVPTEEMVEAANYQVFNKHMLRDAIRRAIAARPQPQSAQAKGDA